MSHWVDIGKKCTILGCGKMDYLSFQCFECQDTFCQFHYREHQCSKSEGRSAKCMVCNTIIGIAIDEDPDIKIDAHLRRNCHEKKAPTKACHACHKSTAITTTCKNCNQLYCLQHRNPLDHTCKSRKQAYNKNKCKVQ